MKSRYTLIALSLVVLVAGALWALNSTGIASLSPKQDFTEEGWQVIRALENADAKIGDAGLTGDIDSLNEVLIDDPVFEQTMDKEVYAELKEYIAEVSGPEVAREGFGYLTAMKNKSFHRYHALKVMEEAEAAKGSPLNAEDMPGMIERNFNSDAGLSIAWYFAYKDMDPAKLQANVQPMDEQVTKIVIEGDRADVYYDGVRSQHAILLRVDGKWYVAQIL